MPPISAVRVRRQTRLAAMRVPSPTRKPARSRTQSKMGCLVTAATRPAISPNTMIPSVPRAITQRRLVPNFAPAFTAKTSSPISTNPPTAVRMLRNSSPKMLMGGRSPRVLRPQLFFEVLHAHLDRGEGRLPGNDRLGPRPRGPERAEVGRGSGGKLGGFGEARPERLLGLGCGQRSSSRFHVARQQLELGMEVGAGERSRVVSGHQGERLGDRRSNGCDMNAQRVGAGALEQSRAGPERKGRQSKKNNDLEQRPSAVLCAPHARDYSAGRSTAPGSIMLISWSSRRQKPRRTACGTRGSWWSWEISARERFSWPGFSTRAPTAWRP